MHTSTFLPPSFYSQWDQQTLICWGTVALLLFCRGQGKCPRQEEGGDEASHLFKRQVLLTSPALPCLRTALKWSLGWQGVCVSVGSKGVGNGRRGQQASTWPGVKRGLSAALPGGDPSEYHKNGVGPQLSAHLQTTRIGPSNSPHLFHPATWEAKTLLHS